MKPLFLLFTCFVLVSFTGTESKKLEYASGANRCEAEMKNGMLNGKYIAWYANGIKKAEGNFSNNQMSGEWSVWDSTGNLRLTRMYENSFTFKTVVMNDAAGKPVSETATHYSLQRDNTGTYPYLSLSANDILVSKQLWRWIDENNTNAAFFMNGNLFSALLQNVKSGKLTAYDPATDEMKIKLEPEALNKKQGSVVYYVAGYKIKEVWSFNKKTQTGEYRITGICPVVESSLSREPFDLFWVDYISARPLLATLPLPKSTDPQITNVDDAFFFRQFSSSIYKESNIYNRKICDYANGDAAEQESDRIELERIDLELNNLLLLCGQ